MKFELSEKEITTARTWMDEHKIVCPITYAGAIGGQLTWCFTNTSLGMISSLKCHCGGHVVLTDFEDW